MFCNHCGAEIKDGVKFCDKCGGKVEIAQPKQENVEAKVEASIVQPSSGDNQKTVTENVKETSSGKDNGNKGAKWALKIVGGIMFVFGMLSIFSGNMSILTDLITIAGIALMVLGVGAKKK